MTSQAGCSFLCPRELGSVWKKLVLRESEALRVFRNWYSVTEGGRSARSISHKSPMVVMDDIPTDARSAEAQHSERIEQIIAKGKVALPGRHRSFLLALLTGVLMWLAFPPMDFGPVAWICLVPLLLLTRTREALHRMSRRVYLGGLIYWILELQWMRYGDPFMYFGLLAMGLYLACYWPLFLWITRLAIGRWKIPLFLAAPIVWTSLEYARAYVATGFSWYYIGHTQHNWIEMIQISDLCGAYGVSFLIVMANAVIAQSIPWHKLQWFRLGEEHVAEPVTLLRNAVPISVTFVLVVCAVGYGYWRRGTESFPTGPRIALIQGNFVASLKPDTDLWGEIYRTHHQLTGRAVKYQPDLVVWPEAMFRFPMHESDPDMSDADLDEVLAAQFPGSPMTAEYWKNGSSQRSIRQLAAMSNAGVIIGITVLDAHSDAVATYNSAVFADPEQGLRDRYDKIHRVIFGEYIPLRDYFPFIQRLTPFRGEWGLTAGEQMKVFQHKEWRILPTICFEDTVPHLVRNMVSSANSEGQPPVDLLVNLTNDGWFHGSSELDQHLITSQFRAIETRTPMARAVNTGISAIIDGDGVVREPDELIDFDSEVHGTPPRKTMRDPRTGKFYKQYNCALVADVPLDPRESLYVRLGLWGDWFAAACLLLTTAVGLQHLIQRRLDKRTSASA